MKSLLGQLSPAFKTVEDLAYYMSTQGFTFQTWVSGALDYQPVNDSTIKVDDTYINFPIYNNVSALDSLNTTIKCFCTSVDYNHTKMPMEYINYTIASYFVQCLAKYIGGSALRPAIGYPSCPAHSLKKFAFKQLGCDLPMNEYYSITPPTTICGFLIV